MSVTAVLVPVLVPEVEALLEGRETPELLPRAQQLRARVAQIDAVREDLHGMLFERWSRPEARQGWWSRLFPRKEPPQIPSGYDPYVHLFGRSLPMAGESGKVVVQRLVQVMGAEDDRFIAAISEDLARLDPRARDVLQASHPVPPEHLAEAIDDQRQRVDEALRRDPPAVRDAYDACVTLSAWSWPVWRLDGVMLNDLVRTLGLTVPPGRAEALFDELQELRPEIGGRLYSLPTSLESFRGAGGFWSTTDVKLVAGSLRLSRSKLAANAVTNGDDADATLRQLRLLEEAVLYCESENLALAEAAGVEWYDRPRRSGS